MQRQLNDGRDIAVGCYPLNLQSIGQPLYGKRSSTILLLSTSRRASVSFYLPCQNMPVVVTCDERHDVAPAAAITCCMCGPTAMQIACAYEQMFDEQRDVMQQVSISNHDTCDLTITAQAMQRRGRP